MTTDPLIQEVRKARQEISEECGNDIWKLYARYDAMQKQMKTEGRHRFMDAPPRTNPKTTLARLY